MHTAICDDLGIEFPIFAFTHCRDVVVAVSKAGGFGVLGAVGFTPEQLEIELNWIDEQHRRPPLRRRHRHPQQVRGHGLRPVRRRADQDVAGHGAAGAPRLRPQDPLRSRRARSRAAATDAFQLLGWTEATATPQVEVALQHPEGDVDRQRARHPAGGHDQAHPRRGPQGRRALRLAVAGAQARRRRRRHHHRPGRRGGRTLRRGRLDRVVAAGRQGGRPRSGAGRGRHRQRRSRSPRRWRWARRARGPARSG